MKKIGNWLKYYWPLVVAGGVIGGGLIAFYQKNHDTFKNWADFYLAVDSASAVALAVLAFLGYAKFLHEKKKKEDAISEMQNQLSNPEGKVALCVQFGGNNNLEEVFKKEMDERGFTDSNRFIPPPFGDDACQVNKADVQELKDYLIEIKGVLSTKKEVHIFFAGAGIGYAVIADILNNSTSLIFYHKGKSDYEVWYRDKKSDHRMEETLHDASPNQVP